MDFGKDYLKKLKTPDEAARLVKSGDWVDYGMISQTPLLFDRALAARKDELFGVRIRGAMIPAPLAVVEADPTGEHFIYNSWHLGGIERRYADRGLCHYIPMNYSSQPGFYRDHLSVDVACVTVTPMDRHGYFNLSLTNSAAYAMLRKAKTVLVEVNEHLPWACGGAHECVHVSEVDGIIEGEHERFPALAATEPSPEDQKIAEWICPRIRDGSTLQIGIGGTPNAVGKLIAQSDVKDLGMHTEMLCDAYLELYQAGKLTNRRKQIDEGKGVWSFCMGSRALYDWMDHNPGLASCPVDYTNMPAVIARNDNVVSINNCISVDLFGQVCAETAGARQISGTGGQLDFVYGAFLSKGGQAFICLHSVHRDKKTGLLRSAIVPALPGGDIVSDPRSHGFYLVTEYGIADLAGCSTWERVERIVSVAHPRFRDELLLQAKELRLLR